MLPERDSQSVERLELPDRSSVSRRLLPAIRCDSTPGNCQEATWHLQAAAGRPTSKAMDEWTGTSRTSIATSADRGRTAPDDTGRRDRALTRMRGPRVYHQLAPTGSGAIYDQCIQSRRPEASFPRD
jgi:hypothetical protein